MKNFLLGILNLSTSAYGFTIAIMKAPEALWATGIAIFVGLLCLFISYANLAIWWRGLNDDPS